MSDHSRTKKFWAQISHDYPTITGYKYLSTFPSFPLQVEMLEQAAKSGAPVLVDLVVLATRVEDSRC
jgi:hypothetical protein